MPRHRCPESLGEVYADCASSLYLDANLMSLFIPGMRDSSARSGSCKETRTFAGLLRDYQRLV